MKISLVQALSLVMIAFTFGSCKGSDSQDTNNSASLFPPPLDAKAVEAFRASFSENESSKPRFHVFSQTYFGDQQIGQIFVGCNLDGKSERICLLDTGSSTSSVPADASTLIEPFALPEPSISPQPDRSPQPSALASGAPSASPSPSVNAWGGHRSDFLPPLLELFTAAGHSFGKVLMNRLSSENYPVDLAAQKISGIIGEDLLRSGGLSLDFKTSEIKFDRIEKAEELPYQFTLSYVPEIELPVHLNDDAVTAVFDTGASFSAINSTWIDQHPEQFETVGEMVERNFSGEMTKTRVVRAKTLRVGDADLRSPLFIALDFSRLSWVSSETQVILGFNVISQGNWKIDYPTLRWSFTSMRQQR
jgi:hypothetical protein